MARAQGLLLLGAFSCLLGHLDAAVLGVAPEDQAKYSGSSFKCLGDGKEEKLVPIESVNDEFCDCEDGSDEPGTGACAGQDVTLFHCFNEKSQARQIYASMVNDGICDCCDGTDEKSAQASSACPNTCAEEGAELAKERAERHAMLVEGKTKRAEIVAKALEERKQAQARLEEVRKEKPELEEQLRVAEEIAKKAAAEAEAAANQTATQTQIDELRRELAEQRALIKTLQDEVAELRTAGAAAVPEAEQEAEKSKPKVSEYAKWMDGAESMEGAIESPEEEEAVGEEDALGEAEAAGAAAAAAMSSEPAKPAVDEKSPEVKELEDKISAKRREERTLKKKIAARPDDRLHYGDLDGNCVEKKDTEYTYKVCFFDDAKQDHTSLGRWKEWTGPHSALFDRGAMCPGGPERRCVVHFECGTETAVIDVAEPSRCAYEMIITHPGACEGSEEEILKGPKVLHPKDEL